MLHLNRLNQSINRLTPAALASFDMLYCEKEECVKSLQLPKYSWRKFQADILIMKTLQVEDIAYSFVPPVYGKIIRTPRRQKEKYD
ncbi:hypothetical protein CEXT_651801 [Caerostris extrusa]|uniref:Uncharacterized protein n=1 Tax=Caerostris extrusa TaxID=172846 RepID=A0AAV4X884_CAEEX|nr:hypothetical protein CEXT_651801 [Caerostris extrusa]